MRWAKPTTRHDLRLRAIRPHYLGVECVLYVFRIHVFRVG
jgi:hypothetical protein